MADRGKINATLDGIAAARARNDNDATQRYFAPCAQYRLAANHGLLADVHVEPGDVEKAVAELIATFKFHEIESLDRVIDGNKAATRWRISVSVDGGERIQTDLGGFWTFDENGLATELHEFADTAQIQAMFRATA